jgi:4'-phosphopantetheinyl transferase
MQIIYQTDSKGYIGNKEIEQLLIKLPSNMHKRALRYKFKADAYDFIVGRLLLKKGLEDLGRGDDLPYIQIQKSGKPHLKDIDFNISHSDNRVVCVLSTKGVVGIDIERIKEIDFGDFDAWFSKTEWREIKDAKSPIEKFYWYWTRKESIIKALGVDLSYLHKIELDATKDHFIQNGNKWFLKDVDFGKEFCGALCSEEKIGDIEIITL